MSNLGDQLQDEIDAILALETASEKGTGEDGDPFADELDAYVQEAQNVFDRAAPDAHDHDGETIIPDAVTTEQVDILGGGRANWYDHILTSEGHVVDVTNYTDIGAAINAARSLLSAAGIIYLPPTGGKASFSTTIEVKNGFYLQGCGGHNKETYLEYTGSGRAFEDQRQAAATSNCWFQNVRIDIPNGGTAFWFWQPNYMRWSDVFIVGHESDGSVAYRFEQDGNTSQFFKWDQTTTLDVNRGVHAIQNTGSQQPVQNLAFDTGRWTTDNPSNFTNEVVMFDGIQTATFIETLCSGSDTAVRPFGRRIFGLDFWIEQPGTDAFDMSNVGSGPNVMVGGSVAQGQTYDSKITDPNGTLTFIGTAGITTRFAEAVQMLDNFVPKNGVYYDDVNSNGVSEGPIYHATGGADWSVVNRNGTLTYRDRSSGTNQVQVEPGGVLRNTAGGIQSNGGGPADSGSFNLGTNGGKIYLNSSGELVAVDEAGNETILT